MLAATDQNIKKFMPDEQGWIKIKVNYINYIRIFFLLSQKN